MVLPRQLVCQKVLRSTIAMTIVSRHPLNLANPLAQINSVFVYLLPFRNDGSTSKHATKNHYQCPFNFPGQPLWWIINHTSCGVLLLVMSPKRGFGHQFRSCLEVSEQFLRHMSLATLDFVKYPKRGPNRAPWLYVPNSVVHFRGHQYETLVSRVGSFGRSLQNEIHIILVLTLMQCYEFQSFVLRGVQPQTPACNLEQVWSSSIMH